MVKNGIGSRRFARSFSWTAATERLEIDCVEMAYTVKVLDDRKALQAAHDASARDDGLNSLASLSAF
jgi:hypothetical protein